MLLQRIRTLLKISRPEEIMRRYFVVNGYDGALTMLGLMMGFHVSDRVDLAVVITSCLAAALALGMSGLSSAYISEAAEQRRALAQLEKAMVSSLDESHHARAATWVPWLVALVNGLSPLLTALIIMMPLWLAHGGMTLMFGPLPTAMAVALAVLFLFGVFLGRVGGTFWLWSGLQSLMVALVTMGLIYLLG
ncbi:VIT1/CCC1 transporter family protein [Thiolapillus sp.]